MQEEVLPELIDLDEEEFRDEVREYLYDDEAWDEFLEEIIIQRTYAELKRLANEISQQLQMRGRRDRAWVKEANKLLLQVNYRLHETKLKIKDYNRAKSADVNETSRKWSTFAYKLADALSRSDMAFMLKDIDINDIDAEHWFTERSKIEKQRYEAGKDSVWNPS